MATAEQSLQAAEAAFLATAPVAATGIAAVGAVMLGEDALHLASETTATDSASAVTAAGVAAS